MNKIFKKITAFFLAAVMIVFGAGMASAAEQTTLTGDINADGAVNSSDALCALMYCVNSYKLDSAKFRVADVNMNNIVNSYDALGILELSAGGIASFSEWKPFEGSDKAVFSLNLLSETDTTAFVSVKLKEGTSRNGTFKLNLHNPDLSCTNVIMSKALSDLCESMEAEGKLSEFSSDAEKAVAAYAGTFDVSEKSDWFIFTVKKSASANITSADISLSVFDSGAKVINNLPSSPDMPDIPTFSLNVVFENDLSAIISVALESGAFRCGTVQLNFADGKFSCTNLIKGDAYTQNSSKIEDDGGTAFFAANKNYAMASFASNMDLTYTGDYILFTVTKSSANEIIPEDFALTVYDVEADIKNNIPEPVVIIEGEVGDNLTWVLNKADKTLTVNCEGTMPSFANEDAPWLEYASFIESVTVKGNCRNIGASAFINCENIKTVKLPSSIALVNANSFNGCTALEEIDLLNNIMLVSNNAFSGCDNLTIWCFKGTKAETFANDNNIDVEYIEFEMSETSALLADGESINLTAEFNTKLVDSDNITWISTNSSCVKVNKGLVSAIDFGTAKIVATANNCTAFCDVTVDIKIVDGSEAKITDNFISGNDVFRKSADDVKNLFVNKNVTVSTDNGFVGTGDTVTFLKASGEAYKTLKIVIFGDTNSDGIYDATDAVIVSCLIDGMLTEEQVGKAVYMAADCNHDGTIDEFDVGLLEKAGLLLEKVPQGKTEEELKTDSVYMQYLSLIDQRVDEQIIEEPESSNSFIQIIIKIITAIFSCIKSIFS